MPAPAGFPPVPQLGPWRVLDALGAGGMGVVYRCRHLDTGALAAVKTVKAAEPEVARALRREIRALARLRHPGVVRILGDDLDAAVPWYAMALVDGSPLDRVALDRDLRSADDASSLLARLEARTRRSPDARDDRTRLDAAAADEPTRPELTGGTVAVETPQAALGRAARIFSRLAATLAWMHGEGVLHGDLKPSNVILCQGDLPVLVDFGLAGQLAGADGREDLEIGAAGGTVAYLSPERIVGGAVDARADLYALGVMLFRALTGRPPFIGKVTAVLADHVDRPAPQPSAFRPDLPPELDALVLALLAKDPRDRTGHAGVVVERLLPWAGGAVPADWPAGRPYLYRPGLVGRDRALTWVDGVLERGGVGLIGGPSGAGKTRLLVEAGRRAPERGLQVVTGRALAASEAGAGVLHPLRGPLRQLADLGALDLALGEQLVLLAPYVTGLPTTGAPPPDLPPALARARLVDAVVRAFATAARRVHLLVLLDDLHDADALTLEALTALASGGREAPMVVLGTWRTDAAAPAVAAWTRLDAARLSLEPLDSDALGAITSDMLAQRAVPQRLVAFLGAHAEGNPLFVGEYLRVAVDRGMLRRDRAGRWVLDGEADPAEIGLPTSIDALLAARLAALEPELARAAELASVLGREVDPALSAALAPDLADALVALVERHVLAETATGYRFTHPALRDRLYAGLAPDRRRDLHRRVLGALPDEPETLGARAWHHEGAHEPEAAAGAYLGAARWAIGRYDAESAERFLRSCLRLAGPAVALAARFHLGYDVLRVQGRLDEATEITEGELALARSVGDGGAETRALRSLAAYMFDRGRYAEALPLYADALALDRAADRRAGIAYGAANLGESLRGLGRPSEALPLFEEAVAIARAEGMRTLVANLLGSLAGCSHEIGDLDAAEPLYREAIAAMREVEDRVAAGLHEGNLANLLAQRSVDDADRLYEVAATGLRAVGAKLDEAQVLANHLLLLAAHGRHEDAIVAGERAAGLYAAAGHVRGATRVVARLVDALLAVGRDTDAARWLDRAAAPEHAAELAAELLVARARVARRAGRGGEARIHLDEARALLELDGVGIDSPAWHLEEAHARAAAGESVDRAALLALVATVPEPYRGYFRPHLAELGEGASGA